MNCCEKCFVDKLLIKHIRQNGSRGYCDYCKTRRAKVVDASLLHDLFDPVLSVFTPLQPGEHFHPDLSREAISVGATLPDCIEWKMGWTVFNDTLSGENRCKLLDAIRSLDPRSGDNCIRSDELWAAPEDSFFHTSEEDIWFGFSEAIKWKRRFIPDEKSGFMTNPKDWLPQYLHEIAYFVKPRETFWRARLGGIETQYVVSKPYPALEMGVPPKNKATAGRANPTGIPYLYVAEKEMTAVAEIRPFLGGKVSVAAVNPLVDLQLVDLTSVRSIESPFGVKNLRMELEKNALLTILNRELSKPVNPALAEIEYVPTQYLAEVILDAGYDGIRYNSAMHSGGFNIVFFDHEKMKIQDSTKLINVVANKLTYSDV